MSIDVELERHAKAWLAGDPDPATRAELEALLARQDEKELADRFAGSLEFGTAGLRGTLGAGPNRMNRAVVRRTTAGLCRYLKAQVPDATARGIVVGRDGRRLSPELLEDTAGVIAAEGLVAHVFEGPIPTPLVSHAVVALGAAAGVMITASHNPPAYNGYKVYWGNGAQIIPPHDAGIARAIDAAPPADQVKLLARGRTISRDVEERYLAALLGLQLHPEIPRDLSIAYTPMHGVGNRFARAVLARAGFGRVETVPEQAEPDGAFPTVAFPNPEEPGAMDLVLALAGRMDADLALANDPDADRLAVAVRVAPGRYQVLTGNEVGILLGYYVLTEGPEDPSRLVITTVVSSGQLAVMARALGARCDETLTGFKWIANRAMELEAKERLRFVFGFEEALGYTVGTVARDKDGIGAALGVAEMAAVCKARGRTLLDELERIQRAYGLFAAGQKSLTLPGSDGAERIRGIMARFRQAPPERVGERAVLAVCDLKAGMRAPRGRAPEQVALPRSDVLIFELEGGARAILRPSGTEPKIKLYFELREEVDASEGIEAARVRAQAKLAALQRAFMGIAGA